MFTEHLLLCAEYHCMRSVYLNSPSAAVATGGKQHCSLHFTGE